MAGIPLLAFIVAAYTVLALVAPGWLEATQFSLPLLSGTSLPFQGGDLLLVIGAPNSSNSRRLVEVGLKAGAKASHLIQTAAEIDWRWFEGVAVGGLTAGASAPEDLVEGVIAAIGARFDVEVAEVTVTREDVQFKLPRAVAG